MSTDFTPRHAIVTASDSGIGAATAIALAEAGLDVGVTWHSDKTGAEDTAEAMAGKSLKEKLTTSPHPSTSSKQNSLTSQKNLCHNK